MNEKFIIANSSLFLDQIWFRKIFKKLICLYLHLYDWITFFKNKNRFSSPTYNSKKILISNIAFLGDVIITTSIIPTLKKHFPKAKLFFLSNSITKHLLNNHRSLERVFCFDHLRLNRKKTSFLKKIIQHYHTKKSTIKQMKKESIDLAIDFCFYNPNSIKLLHQAKIPNILSYTNAGYKNLLTAKLEKPFNPFWHMSEYHLNLLNKILKKEKIRPLEPCLPNVTKPKYKKLLKYNNFIVIHPGAGHKNRYLNLNQVKQILTIIPPNNFILFIGSGLKEKQYIEKIIKGNANCINLANKLHVLDLIYLCSKADMVISTDSAISHIASNFDNPQIVFFKTTYIAHQNLWCLNKPNIQIGKF